MVRFYIDPRRYVSLLHVWGSIDLRPRHVHGARGHVERRFSLLSPSIIPFERKTFGRCPRLEQLHIIILFERIEERKGPFLSLKKKKMPISSR